jgi:hypothetical protein
MPMQLLEGGGGPHDVPAALSPVLVVQEAGWASRPVWTARKILLPPAFDPRTVQPVASRYTDCAKYWVQRGITENCYNKYVLSKFLIIRITFFGQSEFIYKIRK